MPSFFFETVNHFTVGAIGEPGRRVFLLQVADGEKTVTIKLEKQQVGALCEHLGSLVVDLARPGHLPEDLELREPIDIEWSGGEMTARYDEISDLINIIIDEFDATDDDTGTLEFHATREQASAVAIHGVALVAAGRPPCPLCGSPLDPSGHACPRTNGHRPPQQ